MVGAIEQHPAYQWYVTQTEVPKGAGPFSKNNKGKVIILPFELICRMPIGGKNLCGAKYQDRGALVTHVRNHEQITDDKGKKKPGVPVAPMSDLYAGGRSSTEKTANAKIYFNSMKAQHELLTRNEREQNQANQHDSDDDEFQPFSIIVKGKTSKNAGQPHLKNMNQLLKTKQDILRHKRPHFSFPCRECKKLGHNEKQGCTFDKNSCVNRELFDPLDWEAYEDNQAPATSL